MGTGNVSYGRDLLITGAGELGVDLSDEALSLFINYCDELLFWNRIAGITSYRNKMEIFIYMFLDSIAGLRVLKRFYVANAIDLGAGGGFPGLPLKILRPEIDFVFVDSSEKKVRFLQYLVGNMCIEDTNVVEGRIEKLARSPLYRQKFDIVVTRALAPLPVLIEFMVPYLRVGGKALAWKGPSIGAEIENGMKVCEAVGAKFTEVFSYKLPFVDEERKIVIVEKIKVTDERFPRKVKALK